MNRHPELLDRNKAALIVIDIQERVLNVMPDREGLLKAVRTLISGCKQLQVPVFCTEQYPKGLGPTEAGIAALLDQDAAIEKIRFSACCEPELMRGLQEKGIQQTVLVGIESHVCVLQTAFDLKNLGYQVHVVRDGVASRKASDRDTALRRMMASGIIVTNVESALFEMTEVAGSPEFKEISKLVKN